MKKNLVMLVIMDGFGIREEEVGNAIKHSKIPNVDYLMHNYPYTTLKADGEAVGLPDGQMGNSEVGHLNIGAGRVVFQSLTRVNISVRNDELQHIEAINSAIELAAANNKKLHIMGLLSDGGVHSHILHFEYLIEKAVKRGVKDVIVHGFLDGRDVPPKSAKVYFKQLEAKMKEVGNAKFGTISGRYYAMDRDKNYARTQLAYDAMLYNKGPKKDLYQGLEDSYAEGIVDEFVIPYVVNTGTEIEDGDSVIFANFRPDRAIQMSTAITNPVKTKIENAKEFKQLTFVQLMPYSEDVKGLVAFPLQTLEQTLGEVLSQNNMTQLRIAETEKYAHVTYFFDGGEDKEMPGADRILVPSPKVATYDMQPEMSAYEVTAKVLAAIESEKYDCIILNYANCDMVGHTTDMKATIKAVETVDTCVGKVYEAVKQVGGTLLVTADHGNADKLLDEDGKPFSAHTNSPVPFIITKQGLNLRPHQTLGDIAPTILELLGVAQPKEMLGQSIIIKK